MNEAVTEPVVWWDSHFSPPAGEEGWKPPETIKGLILNLKGREFIAAHILHGRSPQSVSNWTSYGIPPVHHRTIVAFGKVSGRPWLTHDYLNWLNDTRQQQTIPVRKKRRKVHNHDHTV